MSDIQLSGELMREVQAAVRKHAPDADLGEIMQYLAALIGYMLGSHTAELEAKRDYIDQLDRFAREVMEDTHQRMEQHQQQAPAAAADNAFGYWTPPK